MKREKDQTRWRSVVLLGMLCTGLGLLFRISSDDEGASVRVNDNTRQDGVSGNGRKQPEGLWVDRPGVRDLSVHAAGPVVGQPLRSVRVGGPERLKGRVVPVHIPPVVQFKGLEKGMRISMPSFDGEVLEGTLNYAETTAEGVVWLAGDLVGREGTFFWKRSAREFSGLAMFTGMEMAVELKLDGNRTVMMEKNLGAIMCRRYPGITGAPTAVTGTSSEAPTGAVPLLYSVFGEVLDVGGDSVRGRPVLYLDFDGEVVQHPRWNGGVVINAARPNLDETDIRQIVSEVAADFSPFNVVVTTDVALLVESRRAGYNTMRCIVTPTSDAAPGAGGVAFLNSFVTDPSEPDPLGVPCWAFNGTDRLSGIDSCAMTISHELGHTFGLIHDGDTSPFQEYNSGFGSGPFSWGPIMGAPFGKKIIQWSKGEYLGANNQEDDIDIIRRNPSMASGVGQVGFQTDEIGWLYPSGGGGFFNQIGVVTSQLDEDEYWLELTEGFLDISGSPVGVNPNLDLKIELLDSGDTVLASSNPADAMDASLSYVVAPSLLTDGKVFLKLRVSSVERGSPVNGGYSRYGSVGSYRLIGSMPAVDVKKPEINDPVSWGIVEWALDGTSCSWALNKVANSPTGFVLQSVPGYEMMPPGCTFDWQKGEIRGVPRTTGVFRSKLTARNSAGFSPAFDVQITVKRKMLSPSSLVLVEGVPSTYQADFGYVNPASLPVVYSISPTLPKGLSFDASTGVLSGVPSAPSEFIGSIQSVGKNEYYAGGKISITVVRGSDALDDIEGRLNRVTARGWKADTSELVTGKYSMVSASTGHGETSWLRAETTQAGWVTFSWKVDSDRAGDFLNFIVNGRKVMSISGNRPWQEVSYFLPTPFGGNVASNVLEWVYEKDASEQTGRDCGWVDSVRIGSRVSIISHPKAQKAVEGSPVKFSCSVTGIDPVFEWLLDGRPISDPANSIVTSPLGTGMTQSVLTLSKVSVSDSGSYTVKISPKRVQSGTEGGGTISTNEGNGITKSIVSEKAQLEVSGLPRMVRGIQAAAVVGGVGGSTSFSSTFTRGNDLVYQWSIGGVRVPGAVRPACFTAATKVEVINGASGSTLRLANLATPAKGTSVTYPVRLEVRSKGGGPPTYQDARLTVRSK